MSIDPRWIGRAGKGDRGSSISVTKSGRKEKIARPIERDSPLGRIWYRGHELERIFSLPLPRSRGEARGR